MPLGGSVRCVFPPENEAKVCVTSSNLRCPNNNKESAKRCVYHGTPRPPSTRTHSAGSGSGSGRGVSAPTVAVGPSRSTGPLGPRPCATLHLRLQCFAVGGPYVRRAISALTPVANPLSPSPPRPSPQHGCPMSPAFTHRIQTIQPALLTAQMNDMPLDLALSVSQVQTMDSAPAKHGSRGRKVRDSPLCALSLSTPPASLLSSPHLSPPHLRTAPHSRAATSPSTPTPLLPDRRTTWSSPSTTSSAGS